MIQILYPLLITIGLANEPLSAEDKADLLMANNEYRYTTHKYGCRGDCDYSSVLNAMKLGEDELWPIVSESSVPGGIMHAPCGSSIECGEESSMFASNVRCTLTINECDFDAKVLETLHLDCRGDFSCFHEGYPSRDCCVVIGSTRGET
jgi:hypothetical protein